MGQSYRKGDSLELCIESLAFGARGVARTDEFVWFVDGGIPGQKVAARIRKVSKSYGEASVETVLDPSPHQADPPCPYFRICGGCQLQHLKYDIQVEQKTRQIEEILRRIGGFDKADVRPTIPAEVTYGYRNKMEFTFSDRRWLVPDESTDKPGDFALGLHVPRRFDKILDIDGCLLQSETSNHVFRTAKDLIFKTGLQPYSVKTHTGFWRFLVIREGKNTRDLMLNLITSGQEAEQGKEAIQRVVHKLFWRHPEITTVLHSITDREAQVALGESERILLGSGKITETIGNLKFEISPTAFFQTNTHQAHHLFDTVADLSDFRGDETVYDLYCGTGAVGMCIANRVKKVIGIEVIETAIADARRNAELNGLSNVEFVLADMRDALIDPIPLIEAYGAPDIVILDPPRGGTHPKTVKALLNLSPPKIVYVSCNPAILARDLQILCEKTYNLKTVQPVDMFPHTGHIEVVALLVRKI
ncbi:MAG: 23S rRNA (uracil(1939)-C(5))-methyltransferase RlmD [bacterium]